jgi:hypothetical protein
MSAIKEIDREIRRLTGEGDLSRPFLCHGSPIGCDVAEVGINPGTDTPFWPYWNSKTGCDKDSWLADYLCRNGRLKPTRDRIEVLCQALAPLRCLELNLYHHHARSEADLAKEHQDTALFDFMLKAVRPRVLLVHGNTPIKHLERLLSVTLEKDQFTLASYLAVPIQVFAAKSHFSRGVSRDYVGSIGERIKARVFEPQSRAGRATKCG